MKRYLSSVVLIIALLVTIETAFSGPATHHKIRIAAFNLYPTIFQEKDGSVQGFYVDFLTEIAKQENWQIEYVYGNWSDGLARLKSGEVDVVTNVAFTPERAESMDYGKVPLLTVWAELYVPSGSSIDNIRDVKNKKIALMKGDFNAANFKNLVEKFAIPCTYVEYGNFDEVFKAISTRQVDGGIANNTFGSAKLREYDIQSTGVIFNPFDIFFTVAKGRNSDIIATLDRYLEEWKKSEESPYHQARERWSHGSASVIRVSHPWIKKAALIGSLFAAVLGAFVLVLRSQIHRKTGEIQKNAEELQLLNRQLEEELAERQAAQVALEKQTSRLEKEMYERQITQDELQEQTARLEEEIEEHQSAQTELRNSEGRYRLLFENMATGYALHEMIYDEHGTPVDYRFLEVNPAFEKLTGAAASSFIGKTVKEIMPGTESYWIENYGHVAKTGEPKYFENYSQELNRYFDCWAFSPCKDQFAVIFSDVTDRKQLQEQLNQAQKLDTIGRLAGGVAHDFNNKLTVILGYAELTKQLKCSDGNECDDYINEIIQAGQHAQEITRRLLTFSRSDIVNPLRLHLNLVLTNIKKTLGRMIGEHISVDLELQQDLWPIKIDPTQFDQVVTNLAVNARDAMQHGGTIHITTSNVIIDEANATITAGEYVQMDITDTGCGIDKTTMEHIFEPFFTTKEIGKGTGLGLSSVYGIVKQNNGHIFVSSQLDTGSTFSILLPRMAKIAAQEVTYETVSEHVSMGRILLVEDEEPVRRITKLLVENLGYKVTAVETPEEALRICTEKKEEIDCVLSDVVMPGMNGKELHDRIKQVRPELPFLFMSGYTADFINDQIQSLDVVVVQKPINYQELNKILSKIMYLA